MTSVQITWSRLPERIHTFVVFHRQIPESFLSKLSQVLLIPDRWGDVPDGTCLLTDDMRVATGYNGTGLSVKEMPALDDGDIVFVDGERKRLEVVFNVNGTTNSLYVTNTCNSKCQFCPQPSTVDDGRLYGFAKEVIELVPCPGECVNITGGEPTIRRDLFVGLLRKFGTDWPQTKAFVLTNGRLLSDYSYVDEIYSLIDRDRIGFGIPLYSDSANIHDEVVGVKGAFGQTIRGLYNLASKHAETEIRFVLSKLTYSRLPQLVQYIGRNLPFVTRIAVMGIEPMGYCRNNWEKYWIDPEDAHDELCKAFQFADNYGLNALLYNFQHCCLPTALRKYSYPTISEWKRVYIDECLRCPMKCDCGGFFASQNKPQYLPRRFAT